MAVCNDDQIILAARPIVVVDLNKPINNWKDLEKFVRVNLHDEWDGCNEAELGPTIEHLQKLGYDPGNLDVSSPAFIDIVATAVINKVLPVAFDNLMKALSNYDKAQVLSIEGNISCLGEVFLNEKYWGRLLLDKILLPNNFVASIGDTKELVFDLDNLDQIYELRKALPVVIPINLSIDVVTMLTDYFKSIEGGK